MGGGPRVPAVGNGVTLPPVLQLLTQHNDGQVQARTEGGDVLTGTEPHLTRKGITTWGPGAPAGLEGPVSQRVSFLLQMPAANVLFNPESLVT